MAPFIKGHRRISLRIMSGWLIRKLVERQPPDRSVKSVLAD